MSRIVSYICFIAILGSATIALALDLKAVKEPDCVGVPAFSDLDLEWAFSHKTWYYPLWSKYELYSMAEVFLEKDSNEITQNQLNQACIIGKIGKDRRDAHGEGFGGKTVQYEYTIDENKIFTTTIVPPGKKWKGSIMKSITTLSDNKKFMLTVQCFENGDRSWSAASTFKNIDEKSKTRIFNHIKSLGFDAKNADEMDYDKCKNNNGKDEL